MSPGYTRSDRESGQVGRVKKCPGTARFRGSCPGLEELFAELASGPLARPGSGHPDGCPARALLAPGGACGARASGQPSRGRPLPEARQRTPVRTAAQDFVQGRAPGRGRRRRAALRAWSGETCSSPRAVQLRTTGGLLARAPPGEGFPVWVRWSTVVTNITTRTPSTPQPWKLRGARLRVGLRCAEAQPCALPLTWAGAATVGGSGGRAMPP